MKITPVEEFAEYSKQLVAVMETAVDLVENIPTMSEEMKKRQLQTIVLAIEEFKKFLELAPNDLNGAVFSAAEFLKNYHTKLV